MSETTVRSARRRRTIVSLLITSAALFVLATGTAIYLVIDRADDAGRRGPPPTGPLDQDQHVEAEIFMQLGATDDEIEAIRAELDGDRHVLSHRYVDEEAAVAEFKRIFADNEDLVEMVEVGDLPASFRVRLRLGDVELFERSYGPLPGVDGVIIPPNPRIRCPDAEFFEDWRERRATQWKDFDAEVLVKRYATPVQLDALRARFEADRAVERVDYVSQEEAVEDFKRLFADNEDLVETIRVGDLPASFRVTLVAGEESGWATSQSMLIGVNDVLTASDRDLPVTRLLGCPVPE